jgi:hypothetical protein
MRKLTAGPERRQGDQTMQPPTRPAPSIARNLSTEFGRRHVKGIAIIRLVVAVAMVALGSFYCASGHWWGALWFVPAALNGWFVYLMPRWTLAVDPENAQPSR